MVNLDKLVCSKISTRARNTHRDFGNANEEGNGYVNTTFELEVEPGEESDLHNLKIIFNEL